jgi:hypothetical protein
MEGETNLYLDSPTPSIVLHKLTTKIYLCYFALKNVTNLCKDFLCVNYFTFTPEVNDDNFHHSYWFLSYQELTV